MGTEEALARFDAGNNCAEAVFYGVCRNLGLNNYRGVNTEELVRICTPFGSGIARKGWVCGALVGAGIAVGLVAGRTRPEENEQKKWAYALLQEIIDEFEGKYGTCQCRELTGTDWLNRESVKNFHARNLHNILCRPIVKDVIELTTKVLLEAKSE